jgi:hypothetical protein
MFDEMKDDLMKELLLKCGNLTIEQAMDFSSISYSDLNNLDNNSSCEVAKVIGNIAVKKLLEKLNDNKPLWLLVICYNLGKLESPHDNHLCYGTNENLKKEFDSKVRDMFLISSISSGQNHVYIKETEKTNDSKRENLRQEILNIHKEIIEEETLAPLIKIEWRKRRTKKSIKKNNYLSSAIVINAYGSLDGNETFEYELISESNGCEKWKQYFQNSMNFSYGNEQIKGMLRTSIQSYIETYPCTLVQPKATELGCLFFPGNKYLGDFSTFVQDGVTICFDKISKVNKESIDTIRKWTEAVTEVLARIISQIISRPVYPVNITPNGRDTKKFIDDYEGAKKDVFIKQFSTTNKDIHNPSAVYELIDNKIKITEKKKQTVIQDKYPKYLIELYRILGKVELNQEKNKLFAISFMYRRIKYNSIYLLDMLSLAQESGWDIDINKEADIGELIVSKAFMFSSQESLILVIKELVNNSVTTDKKQSLSISENKLLWILDTTLYSDHEEKKSLKLTHLDFLERENKHLLHKKIRAFELLTKMTICEYKFWDKPPEEIRTNELLSFDLSAEKIIENLHIIGVNDKCDKAARSQCLMILARDKVRFILKYEWSENHVSN